MMRWAVLSIIAGVLMIFSALIKVFTMKLSYAAIEKANGSIHPSFHVVYVTGLIFSLFIIITCFGSAAYILRMKKQIESQV